MNAVVQLGPLSLNGYVILFVFGYAIVSMSIALLAPRLKLNSKALRSLMDNAIVVGLVSGRLAFGVIYWRAYIEAPWEILYVWQAGFHATSGFIAGTLFLVYRNRFSILNRDYKPLVASLSAALFLGLWTLGSLIWFANAERNAVAEIGSFYESDDQFRDLAGNAVSLNQFAGKPTVINFWATWCGPCRREMPLLANSVATLEEQGIRLVAINLDERFDVVTDYLEANNLSLPVWINGLNSTGLLFERVGGQVMPTTLFINASGMIVSTHIGELSEATLLRGVRSIQP